MSDKFQELFINERNKHKPPIKNSSEDYDEATKKYKNIMKMFDTAYKNVGNFKFIKGCMEFLTNLYTINNLDMNNNILAFNDGYVYDIQIGNFRKIIPSDFITKTTKRNTPFKINDDKIDDVKKLLWSVFENNEIIDYWLAIHGCALFTNKYESLYILTGTGRNSKGVLMSIIEECLGDYFYQGENSFLTGITKKGAADPTAASCKGIRFLSISEPEETSESKCFLNCELIKKITGRDPINTRQLYGQPFIYKPLFTLFLQCNDIPDIKKLDNGIAERLKIIKYKFKFINEPKNNNDRLCDNSLKDKIKNDEEFKDAFIYILLEYAKNNINNKCFKEPNEVKIAISNYIEDNNPVKSFLEEFFIITNDDKDRIKTSDFYDLFNKNYNNKLSDKKVSKDMAFNGFERKIFKGIRYYVGLKKINDDL